MVSSIEPLLTCAVEQHDNAMVLRVAGEIDRSTEDDLAEAVHHVVDRAWWIASKPSKAKIRLVPAPSARAPLAMIDAG